MLCGLMYGVVRQQFSFGLTQLLINQGCGSIYSATRGSRRLWIKSISSNLIIRTQKLISLTSIYTMPADKPKKETKLTATIFRDEDDQLDSKTNETDDLKVGEKFDDVILDNLRESYERARKGQKSIWLDYRKSCYIYLYRGGGDPNSNLAAYDLDGTIIKPKSNKRIPRSATDWDFFSVWTKVKLQQVLRENQSRFVMFTNQNGVGLKIVPLEEVQERIELVTKRLDIPCIVFVAVGKDRFRKPNVGMFELFTESFNDSRPVDFEKSFYCGDAVGYPSHSDADIKFAQRLCLPFLPPEKFLRGVKPKLVEDKNI